MTTEVELAPRHAPGEDARPLVRALAGGVVGALAALAIDGAVAAALGRDSLLAELLYVRPSSAGPDVAASRALLVAIACSASLLYAYGQVRRFLPGPAWLKGAACGFCLWVIAAPALLPRAAGSFVPSGASPGPMIVAAAAVFLGGLAAAVACGAIIGALSPPRPG